jgi:hypothetical protein
MDFAVAGFSIPTLQIRAPVAGDRGYLLLVWRRAAA